MAALATNAEARNEALTYRAGHGYCERDRNEAPPTSRCPTSSRSSPCSPTVETALQMRFDGAMRFGWLSMAGGLPTLVATLALALPAAASATLPEFVDFEGPAGAEQVAVRPASIGFYDVCESGFGGTQSTRSKLIWHRWTSSKAVGAGALWTVSKCQFSSPARYHRYPVRLTLSDAKPLRVRAISSGHITTETVSGFTTCGVRFTQSVPGGWQRSHTYHLIRAHGAYYYSFSAGW